MKLFAWAVILCLLFPLSLSAQDEITWKTLMTEVTYKGQVNSLRFQGEYDPPNFSDMLLALDGQEVIITGYMLPLTVDRDEYFLSMYPFTDCFFCGNGTKESVMEVKLKKEVKKFPYHDRVTMKGILRLNTDPYMMTYTLEDAVQVKDK